MYPIAVVGSNPTARAAVLACRKSGFDDITWAAQDTAPGLPVTLPANISRIINALGRGDQLLALGHIPDREQIRFASSGFLLSEIPLGKFAQSRYGAPHVNIEYADLANVLALTDKARQDVDIADLEHSHAVVLVCTTPPIESPGFTHELWHARTPHDPDMCKANITWLGHAQTAWQFCTSRHTHFFFSTPAGLPLQPEQWHPHLHQAIGEASLSFKFDARLSEVREHWREGNRVYLGEACYKGNVYRREGLTLGLEDAWVLSRMLENYEDDIQDGLQAYEKFRRPRLHKLAKATAATAAQQTLQAPLRRIMRNVNIAFSTRFLPEIAMQRIDWLYNYDCIRGFR